MQTDIRSSLANNSLCMPTAKHGHFKRFSRRCWRQ